MYPLEKLTKLERLATRITAETIARLEENKLGCEANRRNAVCVVKFGNKYDKINIGNSGKLMVDHDGNIFGIKAYGQIHKGHAYGTLDTIDDWFWGEYYPMRKGA